MTKETFWKYAIKSRSDLVSYVKKKGIEDAEDVVDGLFVSLATSKSYEMTGRVHNPSAWFQKAISLALSNAKRKEASLQEKQTRLHAGIVYDPWAVSDARITGREIFASLPLNSQFLVYWHFMAGFETGEIAKHYGMTEEAIKMKIHRIRESLRSYKEDN